MEIKLHPQGLHPLKKDKRDFKLGSIFGFAKLEDIPEEGLNRLPTRIKQQGHTDECSAMAGCAVREEVDLVEYSPDWLFAKEKQELDDYHSFGADLRVLGKVGCVKGFLPQRLAPYSWDKQGRDYIANWNNWDKALDDEAIQNKEGSYFFVDDKYDFFDDVRAALFAHCHDNNGRGRSVLCGARWRTSWQFSKSGVVSKEYETNFNGHAVKVFDWCVINNEPYLKIQNSTGEQTGDKGIYYCPREVFNKEFEVFGALMWKDVDPEEVRQLQDTRNSLIQVMKNFISYLKQLIMNKQPEAIKPLEGKLEIFCQSIQEYEGYYLPGVNGLVSGSRSYRNNNPGNLRYTLYTQELGAKEKDSQGYCVFTSYDDGYQALKRFVQDASKNKLKDYHNCTIESFFKTYAPSTDNNNPLLYANFVAKRVKADLITKLNEII